MLGRARQSRDGDVLAARLAVDLIVLDVVSALVGVGPLEALVADDLAEVRRCALARSDLRALPLAAAAKALVIVGCRAGINVSASAGAGTGIRFGLL